MAPSEGFRIYGADAGDFLGTSVSGAGDVNNDGCDDIIVSAKNGDGVGNLETNAGEAYVIFGGANLQDIDLAKDTTWNGIVIYGADAYNTIGAVSSAGDVNSDGIGDLVIDAPLANSSKPSVGEAYVIFGREDFYDPDGTGARLRTY
ncbi:integrin alpha [Aestuariivirga sp.]|uniref:integrin alpha n=1 Tax=Aestuariivirga sp. TaxID=2650926 RepID=UPI003593333C